MLRPGASHDRAMPLRPPGASFYVTPERRFPAVFLENEMDWKTQIAETAKASLQVMAAAVVEHLALNWRELVAATVKGTAAR
jgi:hypothetical protein